MVNIHKKLLDISINSVNSVEKIISKEICQNFRNNKFLKIKEIAEICHISQSSITRFCNKIGLSGYNELVVLLKAQKKEFNLANSNKTLKEDPDLTKIISSLNEEIDFLYKGFSNIDIFCKKIAAARTIYLMASYDIANIISSFKDYLASLNLNVIMFTNHIYYNNIKTSEIMPNDILISFISGTGNEQLIESSRYLEKLFKEKFCFISLKQKEKFAEFYENIILLNSNDKANNYLYRNFLVEHLIVVLKMKVSNFL